MSTAQQVIVRRDDHGVILRYVVDSPLQIERKTQPADRQRIALLKAERALVTLEIVFEHLELSDVALTLLIDALTAIRTALELRRPDLGLAKSAGTA